MAGTRPPDEDRAYRLLREWSARAEGETTRGEHAHVLDNITTAFFALDHEWRLTHVNQQAAQSFQRPRENLLGKPLWEALPALIGTPFETELRRALHERTTVEFEALHPLSNAWVEVQAQPSNGGLAVYFQDVAERKRSEEPPFEDGAPGLQDVIDHLPDVVARFDRNLRLVYANAATEQLVGAPRKEVLGRSLRALDLPETVSAPWEMELRKALVTGREGAIEIEVPGPDGSTYLHASFVPEHGESGVASVLVIARDLTRQKQQEQRLRVRERHQAAIAHLAVEALSGAPLWRLMEKSVALVAQALDVDHCTVLELQPDGQTLVPRASAQRSSHVPSTSRGDRPQPFSLRRPTIGQGHANASAAPAASPFERNVVSGISVVIQGRGRPFGLLGAHNSKRRTFTQEEVEFLQTVADVLALAVEPPGPINGAPHDRERAPGHALGSSDDAATIDALERLDEAIVVLDADGGIAFANAGARRLLHRLSGEASDATPARTLRDLVLRERRVADRGAENDPGRVRALLEATLEAVPQGALLVDARTGRVTVNAAARRLVGEVDGVEGDRATWAARFADPEGRPIPREESPLERALAGHPVAPVELLLLGADDRRAPVLVSAAPLRGPDGTVAYALVVCQDIAPVKALLRSREDWVGVLARDLQEPLAAVSGLVGLLRRLLEERGLPEEAAKMLRLIATATGHLNRLVADLVDACHVDMGTLGLNKQTIDLLALLRQTVESAHEAAQGRRVRLEIVETLPPIEADADRVRQVVDTLLLAAVQHGYPDTEIRIEANRQGDEALISVTTEGPGIPPDAFAQLFTRFYRPPSARKERVPHVGLGLYISRGIVEAHGGRIWAESTPQERTTFRFTLPIAPSPEGGEAVAPAD